MQKVLTLLFGAAGLFLFQLQQATALPVSSVISGEVIAAVGSGMVQVQHSRHHRANRHHGYGHHRRPHRVVPNYRHYYGYSPYRYGYGAPLIVPFGYHHHGHHHGGHH